VSGGELSIDKIIKGRYWESL